MTVYWGFMVSRGVKKGGGAEKEGMAVHGMFPSPTILMQEWSQDLAAILTWTGFKM